APYRSRGASRIPGVRAAPAGGACRAVVCDDGLRHSGGERRRGGGAHPRHRVAYRLTATSRGMGGRACDGSARPGPIGDGSALGRRGARHPGDRHSRLPGLTTVVVRHVYRPFGARLVVLVMAVALVGATTFLWLAMPAEVRAQFTWTERITILVFFAAILLGLWGMFRTSVAITDSGLVITNIFKVRSYDWAQVLAISL